MAGKGKNGQAFFGAMSRHDRNRKQHKSCKSSLDARAVPGLRSQIRRKTSQVPNAQSLHALGALLHRKSAQALTQPRLHAQFSSKSAKRPKIVRQRSCSAQGAHKAQSRPPDDSPPGSTDPLGKGWQNTPRMPRFVPIRSWDEELDCPFFGATRRTFRNGMQSAVPDKSTAFRGGAKWGNFAPLPLAWAACPCSAPRPRTHPDCASTRHHRMDGQAPSPSL